MSNGNPDATRILLRVGAPLVILMVMGWTLGHRIGHTSRVESRSTVSARQTHGPAKSIESLPTSLSLVDDKEPGTPLVISGQVSGPDGEAVPGARITISHADASGEYGKSATNPTWPRLSGVLATDSNGQYEVRTVKPGTSDEPPHVHIAVGRPGGADEVFEIKFAGDWKDVTPAGAPDDTSTFGTMRPETRDGQGVIRVRRDFRLK